MAAHSISQKLITRGNPAKVIPGEIIILLAVRRSRIVTATGQSNEFAKIGRRRWCEFGGQRVRRIDGGSGIVLLTSRVSVEMVQKTAVLGASILVAVSAPTALAVRVAEACGMTLVAIARGDDFEIFSHPKRIRGCDGEMADLARLNLWQ